MRGTIVNGLAAAVTLVPGLVLAQGNVEKGRARYAQYCASCHGETGKGDGPAAAALSPTPRNLTENPYVPGLKDQYLFDLIQKGGAAVGKSPLMPPWGQALKDQDIRDVIAFVRTLSK